MSPATSTASAGGRSAGPNASKRPWTSEMARNVVGSGNIPLSCQLFEIAVRIGGTILNAGRILALAGCSALIALAGCGHKAASTAVPSASDVTEFDSAVRDGDTEIVSRLIKAKPEMINAKDEAG